MKASRRFGVATAMLTLVGVGLYACSSDDPVSTTTTPDSGTGAETGTGTETGPGTDSSTGTDTGTDTSVPPTKCAYFEADGGRLPVFPTMACKDCASQKCCTQITKCYSGSAADAGGVDGSDGVKTTCELAGECLEACAGNIVCEAQCQTDLGLSAIQDFEAAVACFDIAMPTGCKEVCQ